MKHIFFLIFALIFTGCNPQKEETSNTSKTQQQKTESIPLTQTPPKEEPKIEESKNITKEIKSILGRESVYKVKVKDAKLLNGNIDIDYNFDPLSFNLTTSMMLNYSGVGVDYAAPLYSLNTVFKNSNTIFKKYPDVNNIIFHVIDVSDKRDKYGNKTGESNDRLSSMRISRETAGKINWKFVNDKLRQVLIGGDYKELVLMLDEVK